jgi:rhodanese-related sulfurtransferase
MNSLINQQMREKKMLKKLLIIALASLALVGCAKAKTDEELVAEGWVKNPTENGYVFQEELPAARDLTKKYTPSQGAAEVNCTADSYAAACSGVGVANLEKFLNRDDVIYIDLRDYKDYAPKHFKNFEVVPYFAYIFNATANTDTTMVQLFGGTPTEPVAVYNESVAILNALFPKDKTIFLMCQSGGRVVSMMQILAANGYDMSKIYNVGGVGQYTDSKFAKMITDSGEFRVDAVYSLEGATRK